MARTFYLSKLWQGILTRIGVLETYQGTVPPAEDYNTVADIRAETTHTNGDRIFCLENQIIFTFDDASMAVDDGSLVLKPTNINVGDPGRWVMEQQLALKNHTHAEKANIVAAPSQTRFLISDATGHPVESASTAASFAAAAHTHSGYATAQSVADLDTLVDDNTAAIALKADKYAVVAGDIGKPAVFNADGNVIPGSSIVFHEYPSGALTAGVTKACPHDKDLAIGYLINARSADNENNAMVQVLKPTVADPENSVDIKSSIDIAAPGLIIQILGA